MHLQLAHLHNLIECVWPIGLSLVLLSLAEKAVADAHSELRRNSFHYLLPFDYELARNGGYPESPVI